MRQLILVAACALAACTNFHPASASTIPTQLPSTVTLDDQAGIAVETAYQAAALAERTALKAGFISSAEAPKIAALDNQAYTYVCYTRTAYDLANGNDPRSRNDACPVATKANVAVDYASEARAAVETIKALTEAIGQTKAGE